MLNILSSLELLQQYFENVLPIYFFYLKYYAEICLEKWSNKLLDFYFLPDKTEKQVDLFMSIFQLMKKIFMDFLYGVRHVQENILKK